MAKDITGGHPKLVDFHDDNLYEVITMKDKLSFEKEKGLVENLRKWDPLIWVLNPEEYKKHFDLKGKYPLGEFTFVVDFPLKVMNSAKWCDYL